MACEERDPQFNGPGGDKSCPRHLSEHGRDSSPGWLPDCSLLRDPEPEHSVHLYWEIINVSRIKLLNSLLIQLCKCTSEL